MGEPTPLTIKPHILEKMIAQRQQLAATGLSLSHGVHLLQRLANQPYDTFHPSSLLYHVVTSHLTLEARYGMVEDKRNEYIQQRTLTLLMQLSFSMDLQTDILRTFVAAADAESYTAAAATVHRSQSAVSLQMKRLEENVGCPIFRRNGHAMHLTQEGVTLLRYARRILQLHDEALRAVGQPQLSGVVRLGAPEDYAERLFPIVLARFAQTYPQVQVDVCCESSKSLLQKLDRGQLDLIVRTEGVVAEQGEIIFHEPLVWISSKKHIVHENDPVPLAVYDKDCIFREWAIKSLVAAGRNYRIAYTSPGSAGILAAVQGGLAVAPVALTTVSGDMRILGPDDGYPDLPAATITLMKAKGPLSPAIDSLADYVIETFRELRRPHLQKTQLGSPQNQRLMLEKKTPPGSLADPPYE